MIELKLCPVVLMCMVCTKSIATIVRLCCLNIPFSIETFLAKQKKRGKAQKQIMDYVSGGANTTLPLLLERYRTDKVSSFFSMFCKSVIHITDKTTIDVIQQLHKYSQSAQNKINLFSSHIDGSILLCSVSGCMIFPMRLVLFISTEN